jgi:hypothetical protein
MNARGKADCHKDDGHHFTGACLQCRSKEIHPTRSNPWLNPAPVIVAINSDMENSRVLIKHRGINP